MDEAEVVVRGCTGRDEWPALIRIWRAAVTATHDFLSPDDIDFYESRMPAYLPQVRLSVAERDGVPIGFSGVADGKLEMLFVDPAQHGTGAGSALLAAAVAADPRLLVDVNEQNPRALGFYEHHGFARLGRSATDSEGRPFPIVHLGLR
ncbi:acetyltransferase [Nocardia cyriacigeorgica]|uniref:acetyltransferase n=1 Tax=Nocardia cyriacigeorgica TaxID=135487 RepID=UPI002456AC22|nr:acetyltransferase [Nocardia cyriacigeorgica]